VASAHSIRHWRAELGGGSTHTTNAGSQSLFVLLNVDLPHTRWQKKGCINANKITTLHESELEKSFDARRRTNKLIWLDTIGDADLKIPHVLKPLACQ
jgi:hypothetical protein